LQPELRRATRIHREVIVQDVQKNRRQHRGRERHKTPGEKQHASDEMDKGRHADEVRDETAVMNCSATGFDGGG